MSLNKPTEGRTFVSFKPSIGMLAIKSDESNPEAKPRTYKDPKTDEEKTVYELRYESLNGKLVGSEVDTTGDYGPQLKLTIRDDEDVVFALPLDKGWGQKIAEAVPNIDLKKEVYINAYPDFTASDGSEVKAGVSLKQNGQKVPSKFKTYDETKKEWQTHEGFPEVDQDSIPDKVKEKIKSTKFWGDYNYEVMEFLSGYMTKNHTMAVLPPEPEAEAEAEAEEAPFN
jgi:hypothetical protein